MLKQRGLEVGHGGDTAVLGTLGIKHGEQHFTISSSFSVVGT